MKKLLGLILTVMIAATCLTFTACGGIEGTYKFSYMESPTGYKVEVGQETEEGEETITEDYIVVTINKDTFTLSMTYGDETYTASGTLTKGEDGTYTYEVSESQQYIPSTGTLTIKDGKLTVVIPDYATIVLVKK